MEFMWQDHNPILEPTNPNPKVDINKDHSKIIQEIIALHYPVIFAGCGSNTCYHCELDGHLYPCPTVSIINRGI